MADLRQLSENLFVAPQLQAADVAELYDAGFRAVLCNRPDQEENGQPGFNDIAREADALGLICEFQPVDGRTITDDDVEQFAQHVRELPGPLLAYCRSGTRCTVLWALSQAGHRSTDEILQIAANAGYSLDALRERLDFTAAKK